MNSLLPFIMSLVLVIPNIAYNVIELENYEFSLFLCGLILIALITYYLTQQYSAWIETIIFYEFLFIEVVYVLTSRYKASVDH